jgi:hypothetical protein
MHVGFTCILHERKRLFCARNLCRMNGIPFKEVGDQSMMLDNDFQTCAKRGCSRVSLLLICIIDYHSWVMISVDSRNSLLWYHHVVE